MTGNISLKYLICFLNSKLSEYIFSKIATTTGVGTVRWKKYKIEQLPIPKVNNDIISKFEYILDELLELQKINGKTRELESIINLEIFKLFRLTEKEIEFVNSYLE